MIGTKPKNYPERDQVGTLVKVGRTRATVDFGGETGRWILEAQHLELTTTTVLRT